MSWENNSSRESAVSEAHNPPERISRKQLRGKIALTGVWKNSERAFAAAELLRHGSGCMKYRAGRHSAENTFKLCEAACRGTCFLIMNGENPVHHASIEDLWNEACPDSLNAMRSRLAAGEYRRLRRLHRKDLQSRNFLLQNFS